MPSQCYLPFSSFLLCAWDGSGVVIVIVSIIGQIFVLPVGLCAGNSRPYCLLDSLQVDLRIVWQDEVVQFDLPIFVQFKVLHCQKQSCLAVPRALTQRTPPIILYVGSVGAGAGVLPFELFDVDSRGTRR